MIVMTTTDELEVIKRHKVGAIIRRVAWLNFKLALATWSVVFILVPPTATQNALGSIAWLIVCFLGAVISAVGLTMGFWAKLRNISILVELAGICMMVVGPVVYFITQIVIMVGPPMNGVDPFQQRFALTIYAYAMIAAVLARLAEVIPRFRRSGNAFQFIGRKK